MKKKINISKLVLFFIFLSGLFFFTLSFPYKLLIANNKGIILNSDYFESIMRNKFLTCKEIVYADNGDERLNEYILNYKLFNLFNIVSLKVKVSDNSVYLGGDCLGFALQTKGVMVVGSNYIFTKNGAVNPFVNSGLKVGDIISSVNGKSIDGIDDLNQIVINSKGKELSVVVKRKGEEINCKISPQKDLFTNEYKLGLWIKDNAEGVGTLTFVEDENLRFGALGHGIYSNDSTNLLAINDGKVFDCNVMGVKKGVDGQPGELIGTFSKDTPIGDVDKNCECGVYGLLYKNNKLIENKPLIAVGSRTSVKPGKAQIFTSLDGRSIECYDIEIIKANYQDTTNQKSLIFRVIDKKLIEKTGGIVQGMSGSPIVQNNKIIGAVTHVFVNDPTKGFGIYLDWMILE